MKIIYELSWLWETLGIGAYGGGCLCDWCYADMRAKKKKKLSMKSTVVIGIAAFIIAIVADY